VDTLTGPGSGSGGGWINISVIGTDGREYEQCSKPVGERWGAYPPDESEAGIE
jgi:hypothetical protein